MLYKTMLFLHILGVLWFVAGHGVAVFVERLLSRERRLGHIASYLELSRRASLITTGPGTLLIVGTGLTLAALGGGFGAGALRLWVALSLLLGTSALAVALVGPHYRRLRRLVRQAQGEEATTELQALLGRRTPSYVGYVALAALVFILYLMIFKPF